MLASRAALAGRQARSSPGHQGTDPAEAAPPPPRGTAHCLAMIGNPYMGKSTLFGALTSLQQSVGSSSSWRSWKIAAISPGRRS